MNGYVFTKGVAARSEAARAAGARRYRQAKRQIAADANPGVRVSFFKAEEHMSVAESIPKRIETPATMLVAAIEKKEIDAMDAWLVICKLAVAAFPGVSEAQATTSLPLRNACGGVCGREGIPRYAGPDGRGKV